MRQLSNTPFQKKLRELSAFTAKTAPNGAATRTVVEDRRKALTREHIETMVADYQGGVRAEDLALRFGVHMKTVYRHLRAAYVSKGQQWHKLTDAELEDVRNRYEAGESMEKIGQEIGAHPSTIRRRLLLMGVEIRRRGPVRD
jgi:transposase-like protein